MPFSIPTLDELRALNRDNIAGKLQGGSLVPNSLARVLADADGGLAHLTLRYIAWLSQQFLPDTAEDEWLKRFAVIWLGGWKQATFAAGAVTATGTIGTAIPNGSPLTLSVGATVVQYQTTADATIGPDGTTTAYVSALTAGAVGNLDPGTAVSFSTAISGVTGSVVVVRMTGGADEETDDEIRNRVLARIRKPPMGGDADDYVAWALSVPGVTRAWASPMEMGVGTMTVRIMCDDLRATNYAMTNGFPLEADLDAVSTYINGVRPVTVKELYVVAPIPEPINFTLSNLDDDGSTTKANIAASVTAMLQDRARPASSIEGVGVPAQEIYASDISAAVSAAAGVDHFDLTFSDHAMPSNSSLAVLGSIFYP